MIKIKDILQLKIKPNEKQKMPAGAVVSKEIAADDFISFFESASDVNIGVSSYEIFIFT